MDERKDGGQRLGVVDAVSLEGAGSPRSHSLRRAARSRSNCARPAGVAEGACALPWAELCVPVSCGDAV